MVIEHTFVTTMPVGQALTTAGEFLSARGFQAQAETAFTMGGAWQAIELLRGKAGAGSAKSLSELPQRVRLEWDRGRVVVAASIYPKNDKHQKNHVTLLDPTTSDIAAVKVPEALGCLLFTVVRSLELLLAQRNPEEAANTWQAMEAGVARRAVADRQRLKSYRNRLLVIFGVGILAVVLAILAFSH
ncbi:hypothetical protein [Humisphaera borealis]|uniref:Uncharacterized protein n=1 Tax=Humisphaera borealis TaxID=2807512 RepID=A0A7M2WS28_9BACT|nr:hypothetical protein [Humisphaera borealis]QOV88084.1 hypothetical protein IPV69_17695 [Humisphaera borealis]